jgi:glycosyltransferase involved in cell wall biosynthesis
MKKLIFAVTNDLNFDQRMIRICSSLSKSGYKVVLVGRERKSSQPLTPQSFAQKRLRCFFEKGKLFYLEYNLRLFFFLLFQSFDLVCGVDLDTILPTLITARLKRKKCVYDAHEYFTETPEVVHRPFTKGIWTMVAAFAVPRVDAAYTVGQGLARILGERYAIPFGVVRNVPFSVKEISEIKPNVKVLFYQGALNEGRGLPELIRAMPEVNGAILWLAGEGDLSNELRAMVKDLHLENKVIFLGYVRPIELGACTNQAYIGLNLLENKGLSYYYSLANKAFDYIQAEKPAIQMDFPEYRLLNELYETSLLISDLKTATILEAINKLLEDEEYYLRLQANTKFAKLVYNWEKEEKVLINIYNNILTK